MKYQLTRLYGNTLKLTIRKFLATIVFYSS